MAEQKLVHVMALSPEHQLALRLLLAHHLKMQMRYVLDFLALNPTFSNVEKKWLSMARAFDTYEEITGSFPTLDSVSRAHTKLFAYNDLAMNYLITAVERFRDDDHVDMETDEIEFIQHNYDDLKVLVETSLKHEYTVDEVKKASL